ncbi:VirK/YbjX family protein [Pseudomonas inefficax]|uniref:VirK/YbjX family protein n=1 Tax=Pseudomonas inefficax TaxID=2078786 RepID=UPI0028BD1A35|nr:VirK/YbjX family protein [Pseudomonas inefficax]WNN39388.1 VirK/YbjX family protein [Pseudomonas inefficax]
MMLGTIVKSVFTLQPGYSLRALNNKYKLTLQIARQWPELNAFLQRMTAALGQQGLQRLGVDCIGVVQWPYLSKCWEAPQRLEVLASHFEVLAGQFPALLLLGRDESLTLCELSGYSPGCRLVLDRPIWFKREGELVLNLFQTDLRVASLAFSLCRSQGELCLFIGAVQGIHKGIDSETSLAIYRDLTKDFEGLRPRSLLLEALKCLARTLGVAHLYAVTDACRHHRHAYFGNHKGQDLAANYDVIWLEHGAIASNHADFLALPLAAAQRAEQDIPAKKRAMYRRRQALLDHVFARLQAALPGSGHNLGLQEEQGDAPDEPASAARRPPVVGNLE